ncbi:hypothetical protein GCM10017687_47300 [Streptomyces echinatus]
MTGGVPAFVHDTLQVLGGQGAQDAEGLFVDGVVVPGQLLGRLDADLRDLGRAVPVAGVVPGQVEAEAFHPVLREPDLVEVEGVGDVVVLHPGEVPDQPGDGVGVGSRPTVQFAGAEAVEGGMDFFLDAAEAVDEDVLGMHTDHHRKSPPLTRPESPRERGHCPSSAAGR